MIVGMDDGILKTALGGYQLGWQFGASQIMRLGYCLCGSCIGCDLLAFSS